MTVAIIGGRFTWQPRLSIILRTGLPSGGHAKMAA
jgi:hypothetical protein